MSVSTDGGYLETYYRASAALPPPFPQLQCSTTADVCVVGGGIAGCSAALELAERGYRVVLLEAERIGWGASGRSGGQVVYGLAVEQSDQERELGEADARRVWDISLAGLAWLKTRIERHAIDCDFTSGQMYVAIKSRHWRMLQQSHAQLATRYAYASTQLLARDELQAVLASERYLGALYDHNSGHLHSLRYTLGLARAATAAGVEIHEASRVIDYARVGARGLRVRTQLGGVDCAHVLFAGNAWLGATVPELQRTLLTIASYIVVTEPLGEHSARHLIANHAAVCDTNWILDYFRCTADHRLMFGGRVNYSGSNVRAFAPLTVRRMLRRISLRLEGKHIDYAFPGDA